MFARPSHGRVRPGGPHPGRGFSIGRRHSRVSGHPEVRGELPVAALAEEIETPGPGQIRALITNSGNPVRSCPESERLDRALASLEFMVSVDIYVNETTRHADVILPSPSPFAKPHFDLAFQGLSVRNVVNYSPPVHAADAPGEPGVDEHEILARLAMIAGGLPHDGDPAVVYDLMVSELARAGGFDPETELAKLAPLPPVERMLDLLVRAGPYDLDIAALRAHPHGIDLGPLEPRLGEVLRTPSATVELAPDPIIADVERLAGALAPPAPDDLLLVGRRHLRSNNSWMHNVSVLVKGRPRCTLQIHPLDASRLGLESDGMAEVCSTVGSVIARVEVTDEISPGVVSLPHGWGHDEPGVRLSVAAKAGGVNANVLTDGAVIDPLSGNARLNAIPVTVARR